MPAERLLVFDERFDPLLSEQADNVSITKAEKNTNGKKNDLNNNRLRIIPLISN
jgi:hypothetical protein